MNSKQILTQDERRAAFAKAGIDLTKDITLFSAGGLSNTTVYGALKDISTGRLALYDGSWGEYVKNKERKKVTLDSSVSKQLNNSGVFK